ncbi:MAG: metallopeptidase family protein [Oscillospiraceae bacterium]|nr:metallopeptidase family protein [Oscillospiraceae bacterium]
MGRYISIFYGSFVQLYGHYSKEDLYEELKKTLIHEFTHHVESLAGDRTLADKCESKLRRYLGS